MRSLSKTFPDALPEVAADLRVKTMNYQTMVRLMMDGDRNTDRYTALRSLRLCTLLYDYQSK